MTNRADRTLARANRQAIDLLDAALRSGRDGRMSAASFLLGRVRETLVAGLELYERDTAGDRRRDDVGRLR